MFCPQCRDEFREGFTRCQQCQADLVEALPAPEPPEEHPAEAPAGAAPAPAGGRAIRLAEAGLLYFVAFGSSLVTSLHHFARHFAHEHDPAWVVNPWSNLVTIASWVPPLCLLAFVLTRRGRTLRDLGLTFRWIDAPLGVLMAIVAWPSLLALVVRTPLGLKVSAHAASLGLRGLHFEVLAPLSLLAILCSAAAEELIVRAYLMTEILELTGSAVLAIGVSVFLQDAYHLYQGLGAVVEHIWGFLAYSLFYWRTRRATPLVLAHFCRNLWLALHY